jgi:membrane protein required for beta-lactamase induction
MSQRAVFLLGAAILAASTQLFSLWTVQIFVVPTVIVLVLFGLLFLGPAQVAVQDVELPAWLSARRQEDDDEQYERRSPRSAA